MSRSILSLSTLVAALSTACLADPAADETFADDSAETPAGEADDLTLPADPGLDQASDELDGAKPAPETPDGRITFVADEDGDLIVHATVTDEVRAAYPDADHYRMRVSGSGDSLLVDLVSVGGEVLEVLEIVQAPSLHFAGADAVQVYFPFPALPPIVACQQLPCPWWPSWPQPGGDLPDHLELVEGAGVLKVRGEIGGSPIGHDVQETADGPVWVPVAGASLDSAQETRLAAVQVLLDDLAALQPEIGPLSTCGACALALPLVGAVVAECALYWVLCPHAADGLKAWEYSCGNGCDD